MKVYLNVLAAALVIASMAGCASKLFVYDSKGKPLSGVPVGTPVLMEVIEKTTYEASADAKTEEEKSFCTPELKSKLELMPLGETVYLSFDPAFFGKGEFKLEFSDTGSLKVVSVNSDASANVGKAVDLLAAALPYVAEKKTVETSAFTDTPKTSQEKKDKYCIKKSTEIEKVVKVVPKESK